MGFNEKLWADTRRNTEDIRSITNKLIGLRTIKVVAIGDSTTAGGLRDKYSTVVQVGNNYIFNNKIISEEQNGFTSWFTHLCLKSKGALKLVHNAGVASDTTVGMLARFSESVLSYYPDACFIGDAHNDFSAGSVITESETRQNILNMINILVENGIVPIVRLIYPDSNNAVFGLKIRRHNDWLKYIADEYGLLVVDTYSPVIDTTSTTGAWVAGNTLDGTHPSYQGSLLAGQRALEDLQNSIIAKSDKYGLWIQSDRVSDTNLLLNPLFQDDINADGKADNWQVTGTATLETEAGILGKYQKCVISSGTGKIQYELSVDGTKIKAGDKLKWSGLVKISSSVGSLNYYSQLYFPGKTESIRPIPQVVSTDVDWTYIECESIVPAGATLVRIEITSVAGTGTIQMAQQSLKNMSLV